jgi:hypothetical protein
VLRPAPKSDIADTVNPAQVTSAESSRKRQRAAHLCGSATQSAETSEVVRGSRLRPILPFFGIGACSFKAAPRSFDRILVLLSKLDGALQAANAKDA